MSIKIKVTEAELKELRVSTKDAHSFYRYGRTAWNVAIRTLANFGFDKWEIKMILRSKYMRWAADCHNGLVNGHEHITGREIGMYLEEYPDAAETLFVEARAEEGR